MSAMGRREFVALFGATAGTWPLAAQAQSAGRMRRVGVLTNLTQTDSEGGARDEAFVQGLRQLGWTEGDNLRIDRRWTEGDAERGRQYAAELVALAPDVILTTGSAGLIPLLQVTRTIPIVFTIVPDPVGAGRSAVCCPTETTCSIAFGARRPMPIASLKAPSRASFPCRPRSSSSW